MYRVYHLNRYVRSFADRDQASEWIWNQKGPEDYEILDNSDF